MTVRKSYGGTQRGKFFFVIVFKCYSDPLDSFEAAYLDRLLMGPRIGAGPHGFLFIYLFILFQIVITN